MNEQEIRRFAKENFIPIVREKTSKILIEKVKEINPKNILEIGTAIGYSGMLMLENSEAFLTTLEINENRKNIALKNFNSAGFQNRVNLVFGDCKTFIESEKEVFDFIFLDGPKGQYVKYLPHLINMLSRKGLMFCDNVLFEGLVQNYDAIIPKKHRTIVNNLRKFLKIVSEDKNLECEILDVEDGICLIKKKNNETEKV